MSRLSRVWIALLCLTLGFMSFSTVMANEVRTLRVTMLDYHEAEPRQAFTEILVPKFEAQYPGVKVELEWLPWTGYVDAYLVRYAGGLLGDVISIGSSGLGQFAASGMIQSIDSYVRDWEGFSDFVPPAIEDVKINGEFYALPYRLDVRTLVYNRDYFEEAGLDKDTPPKTWEDLRTYARRVTKYNDEGDIIRQGFDVHADFVHVLGFVYQAGGGYISEDGKSALVGTDESIEAIEFLHSLIHEDRVSLPSNGSWRLGNVAMMMDNPWLMELGTDVLDPGVAEPLTHREQVTNVHINKWGVASTSQNVDLAVEWMKFVLEPEHLSIVSQKYARIHPRISVINYEPYNADPRWNTWLTAAMLSKPLTSHVVELVEVAGKYNAALRNIFQNKVPARTALVELANDLNNNVLGK